MCVGGVDCWSVWLHIPLGLPRYYRIGEGGFGGGLDTQRIPEGEDASWPSDVRTKYTFLTHYGGRTLRVTPGGELTTPNKL